MQCLHSQYYAAFEFTVEQFRQGSIYMHGTVSRRYASFNNCNVFFLSTETACSEGVYDTPYGNFSFARI